jgi:hypothetical protein
LRRAVAGTLLYKYTKLAKFVSALKVFPALNTFPADVNGTLLHATPLSATCPDVPVNVTISPEVELVGPVTTAAPEPVVFWVAAVPNPRLVLAVAMLARSLRLFADCMAPTIRESLPCAAVPLVVP